METFFIEKNKEKKIKFKSYYVVWKPNCPQYLSGGQDSLNRTM